MNSAAKAPPPIQIMAAKISAYAARLFPAVILLGLTAPLSVSAQDNSNAALNDVSHWNGQAHSAARLIAGAASKDRDTAFLRAGIEIKLAPGWQTYWRD